MKPEINNCFNCAHCLQIGDNEYMCGDGGAGSHIGDEIWAAKSIEFTCKSMWDLKPKRCPDLPWETDVKKAQAMFRGWCGTAKIKWSEWIVEDHDPKFIIFDEWTKKHKVESSFLDKNNVWRLAENSLGRWEFYEEPREVCVICGEPKFERATGNVCEWCWKYVPDAIYQIAEGNRKEYHPGVTKYDKNNWQTAPVVIERLEMVKNFCREMPANKPKEEPLRTFDTVEDLREWFSQ